MEFYPYLCEENSGVFQYKFYTENSTYGVSFVPADTWGEVISGSEYLFQNGWVCSFSTNERPSNAPVKKVKFTICKVFEDFLRDKIPHAVLLYVCDDFDKKHQARNKLFQSWYKEHVAMENSFNLQINYTEIQEENENGEIKTHFFGCIYSNDIQEDVKENLENFSSYLLLAMGK